MLRVGRTSYLSKAWSELKLQEKLRKLLCDASLDVKVELVSYGMDCALQL